MPCKPLASFHFFYCIICIFMFLCMLFFFLFLIIVNPSSVKFYITEASLTQFNLTSNNTLYYNFKVNITVRNPNKHVIVNYRRITAIARYKDNDFDSVSLTPFDQGHKNITFLQAAFEGQSVMMLKPNQLDEYKEESSVGIYTDLAMDLDLTVKFKFGMFKKEHIDPPIVQCRCSKVPLIFNGKTVRSFSVTQCSTDPTAVFAASTAQSASLYSSSCFPFFLFMVIIYPTKVKLYISEASITQFNLTSNNTLYYNFKAKIKVRNRNKHVLVYYRRITAIACYKDNDFDRVSLTPFDQGHKNTTFLQAAFEGQSVMRLNPKQLDEYKEETSMGVYNDLAIDLDLTVIVKFGMFKKGRFNPPIIQCPRSNVPLISNGKSRPSFAVSKCCTGSFFQDRNAY